LLDAARRLADAGDPLGRTARAELPAVTGLSPQGVELGLTKHLETDASPEEVDRLIERAGDAPHVHVVLSANVFVGAARALALAVAAAPRVSVRPSRREAVMAPLLARALAEGSYAVAVEVVGAIAPARGDEVHVYGRRQSIADIERASPPGVRVRGHGPGMGVAVVELASESEAGAGTEAEAARDLSWDVIAFDQRGCLSPRIALVSGPAERVEAWFDRLAAELALREGDVPRGTLTDEERSQGALYRETMAAVGRCREVAGATLGLDLSPRSLLLPPSGRHLHVARVRSEAEARALFAPFASSTTSVGAPGDGPFTRAVRSLAPGARHSSLGAMQTPPLDGPVDLRGVVGA
jgi:hypothetical protein